VARYRSWPIDTPALLELSAGIDSDVVSINQLRGVVFGVAIFVNS
jgi:hypothetical protein